MPKLNWALVLAVAFVAPLAAQDMPAPPPVVPAGEYKLDKSHATLTFVVNHLGFSNYHGQFTSFDATMTFDPSTPTAAKLTATIDPNSLSVPTPPPGFLEELKGEKFLDTAKYPEMKFVSTSVEITGETTGKVTGDFTLHGVTKPVTLDVTFNGGWAGLPGMDPHARAGFSAKGTLNRSEFGIGYGVPAPGSTMGVSDAVEIIIEAEFTGPELVE
jgi:polyisoprenoid-binding protein YceI